ncbi:MAG: response regulator transcription factor [Calditrichaeota bacterium]|nr:response regulator transcription factor [Calditrichota bacterium]
MIRIVIVEDNRTIREGLTVLINGTEGLRCVASYRDCEKMLSQLEQDQPDLILMDIGLPGMSGIEGVKRVKEKRPETQVVMLTVYEDDESIFKALCNGAIGYLLKKTPPAQLLESIRSAYEGGSPMSSQIARKVVNFFQRFAPEESEQPTLSKRELEILEGLSRGNSYKMLADSLCISMDTVRYHIRNIYKKLHVHSQSEAVAKALRKGWI